MKERKVVLSIGNCEYENYLDAQKFLSVLAKDLRSGSASFDGMVIVADDNLNERFTKFFDGVITGMSSVLSMALNAFHLQDRVSSDALDLTRKCDRVFFNAEAVLKNKKSGIINFDSSIQLDLNSGKKISEITEVGYRDLAVENNNKRFTAFPICAENEFINQVDMREDYDLEVFGDIEAFNRIMRHSSSAKNDPMEYPSYVSSKSIAV